MDDNSLLVLVSMDIDTHQEPVVCMRSDCHVCRSVQPEAYENVILASGLCQVDLL